MDSGSIVAYILMEYLNNKTGLLGINFYLGSMTSNT